MNMVYNCMAFWVFSLTDSFSANPLFSSPIPFLKHLVVAKMLLMKKDTLPHSSISTGAVRSISWWLFRSLLIHQKLMDQLSSSLFNLLQVSSCESLLHFGALGNVLNYLDTKLSEEDASTIVSVLHLEVGIIDLICAG